MLGAIVGGFYRYAKTLYVQEVRLDENGNFPDPPGWVLEEERLEQERERKGRLDCNE